MKSTRAWLLLVASFVFVHATFPLSEWWALEYLYNSTNGPDWLWNSPSSTEWNFSLPSRDPCTANWQGITCTCDMSSDICHVRSLNLTWYNVSGSLPPQICDLTILGMINLEYNNLTGTIPTCVGGIQNLTSINMAFNSLKGTLPPGLLNLSSLQDVQFQSNYLTGSLSSMIGGSVMTIDLSNNILFGSIPFSSWCPSSVLESLSLAGNKLSGHINGTIGGCTCLQVISLAGNKLSGTLPMELAKLQRLTSIDFAFAGLGGHLSVFDTVSFPELQYIRVFNNNFVGPLPSLLFNSSSLVYANFGSNYLNGTIPVSVGLASSLQVLNIGNNLLNGTIPVQLTEINSTLVSLDVSFNILTGSIDTFWTLTGLVKLTANLNRFNGTLSASVGLLANLQLLDIGVNHFTGTLPLELAQLRELTSFSVLHNNLGGNVHKLFEGMQYLQVLVLGQNNFTGSLPNLFVNSTYPNWTAPFSLFCSGNHFEHSFPEGYYNISFGAFSVGSNLLSGDLSNTTLWDQSVGAMEFLDIADNCFSGNIAELFVNHTLLSSINVSNNHFHGSAPISSGWTKLHTYDVSHNQFNGSIPADIFETINRAQIGNACTEHFEFDTQNLDLSYHITCVSLYYLAISSNFLTGRIPTIPFTSNVTFYFAENNFLAGPFENVVAENLQSLWVSHNSLNGTIPASIASLQYLVELRINNNILSGTLPEGVASSYNMYLFFASYNVLTGPLIALANSSSVFIDVSNNHLTGSIPTGIFSSPALESFSASVNCFSGSLPDDLCVGGKLTTLLADGLKTSPSCRQAIFPRIKATNTFVLKKPRPIGTIPACLFTLPKIVSIHLSGNYYSGSLPAVPALPPSLLNLSVEHNALTGPIPHSFQDHNWSYFSVAYNRLKGTLHSTAVQNYENASVSMIVNRLSGPIPSNLLSVENIQILEGNMFSCNVMRTNLPIHDPNKTQISCGSDNVNRSFFVWLGFAGFAMVICAVLASLYMDVRGSEERGVMERVLPVRALKYIVQSLDEILAKPFMQGGLDQGGIHTIRTLFRTVRSIFVVIAAVCVLLFMPTYGILSYFYRTHEEKYIWWVSALMLSGLPPAAVLFLIFTAILIGCWAWMALQQRNVEKTIDSTERHPGLFAMFFAVNFVVMLGVDLVYVYFSRTRHVIVQTSLALAWSFFRVVWADLYVKQFFVKMKLRYAGMTKYHFRSRKTLIGKPNISLPTEGGSDVNDTAEACSAASCTPVVSGSDVAVEEKVNIDSIIPPDTGVSSGRTISSSQDQRTSHSHNRHFSVRHSSRSSADVRFLSSQWWRESSIDFGGRRRQTAMLETESILTAQDYMAITATMMLNNVLIPNIAALLFSPSCFFNAFVVASTYPGTYTWMYCANYLVIPKRNNHFCTYYSTESAAVSYDPPFIYSYNCASTFVTLYAESFVYFMIIVAFLVPARKLFLCWWESILLRHYPEGCYVKRSEIKRWWHVYMVWTVRTFLPQNMKALRATPASKNVVLFDRFFVPSAYSLLAVILTYGVISPLIAVVIALGAIAWTYFEEAVLLRLIYRVRCAQREAQQHIRNTAADAAGAVVPTLRPTVAGSTIGKRSSAHTDTPSYSWYLARLDEEGQGIVDRFTNPVLVWLLLLVVTPFYAFLLFDTAADSGGRHGWKAGTVLAVLLLALPPLLLCIRTYLPRKYVDSMLDRAEGRARSRSSSSMHIDMTVFGRRFTLSRRSGLSHSHPSLTKEAIEAVDLPERDSDMDTGSEASEQVTNPVVAAALAAARRASRPSVVRISEVRPSFVSDGAAAGSTGSQLEERVNEML